jgi:hypothetical protein
MLRLQAIVASRNGHPVDKTWLPDIGQEQDCLGYSPNP